MRVAGLKKKSLKMSFTEKPLRLIISLLWFRFKSFFCFFSFEIDQSQKNMDSDMFVRLISVLTVLFFHLSILNENNRREIRKLYTKLYDCSS